MRKPIYAICEQQRRRSACAFAQSDQHLYCSLPLDSMIPILAQSKISRLQLVSVAEQAGLCLPWSQTPKTGFLMTGLIYDWVFVKALKSIPLYEYLSYSSEQRLTLFEPRHEKTCLRGLRPGKTQTGLRSQRS